MISDVLRRPTAKVAGIVAAALGLVVVLVVLLTRDHGPTLPIVTATPTDAGVVLRWSNPEADKAYGPLTYDVEVLDQNGKREGSYLKDVESRAWPGCCRLLITPGGSITKTLPRQSRPIGAIRLVNQYLGRAPDGEYLSTITCRFTPTPKCTPGD